MAFVIADRVKETSTTVGTGALTLAGAITGFQSFTAKCSVGDTVYYGIQTVDVSGAPTGEWECGLGTYSGANILTRTTVTSSSNAGAVVTLSAGTKQVYITLPAVQVAWLRERVTANRTYYVRTDGSNSNDGLANTAGSAFLTIQKAVDVIRATLDISAGVVVTIQIADGTHTGAVTIGSIVGAGTLTIQGNSSTPSSVVISTTSATCFSFSGISSKTTLKDVRVQTTTSGYGIIAGEGSFIQLGNIVFGACADGHVAVITQASLTFTSNYSVVGASTSHLYLLSGGRVVCIGKTVTITGTPAVIFWLDMSSLSTAYLASNTYSGSITGTKYTVKENSVCAGGGTLPGTGGSTASGGLYL